MDVELYVYDLSKGMARQVSASLLGVQIDAIFHTSIVFKGVEYVYDGGIQTVRPGQTHLGAPMQIMPLGRTELPMDVIMDYLESMKTIYTPQKYDLWSHNCNNFSNDFATFLVGTGIPDTISNLPQTVLDTPFGRMLKPMIDDKVKVSKQRQAGAMLGLANGNASVPQPQTSYQHQVAVKLPTSMDELDEHLKTAQNTCAVIFFTSQTCLPCRPMYPIFEQLAGEAGRKASLIKVDINKSPDMASRYQISATPTFTPNYFVRNVQLLINIAFPRHGHEDLRLPTFRNADRKPVLYSKLPPLDKLLQKMGDSAKDPAVQGVAKFLAVEQRRGAAESTLPNMDAFSWYLRNAITELSPDVMFAVIDLVRLGMADPRFSGYFAEEKDHKTIGPLLGYVNSLKEEKCPYPLRLVALQTACNLFSSPLYTEHVLDCEKLTVPVVELITTSLLDGKHPSVRVAASCVAFNMAVANSQCRIGERREMLSEDLQIELAASLLEAISAEENSAEALKGSLLALGFLVFCVPENGEIIGLLKTMDASGMILGKSKAFAIEPLVAEIGELTGKGIGGEELGHDKA